MVSFHHIGGGVSEVAKVFTFSIAVKVWRLEEKNCSNRVLLCCFVPSADELKK